MLEMWGTWFHCSL